MIWLSLVLFLFTRWPLLHCTLVNRTIDDVDGDEVTGTKPIYDSTDSIFPWSGHTSPLPAGAASYHLDATRLLKGTWHDSIAKTGQNSITLTFSGVAIYVFFVLPINGGDYTAVDFRLDGEDLPNKSFFFNKTVAGINPNNSSITFLYDQPVFSQHSLSNNLHTLVISMSHRINAGVEGNLALFDYAVYSQPVQEPSRASTNVSFPLQTATTLSTAVRAGAIVGGVFGGLVAVLLVAALANYCTYRRKNTPTYTRHMLSMDDHSIESGTTSITTFDSEKGHDLHYHHVRQSSTSFPTSPPSTSDGFKEFHQTESLSFPNSAHYARAKETLPLSKTVSGPLRAVNASPTSSTHTLGSSSKQLQVELASLRDRVRALETGEQHSPPNYDAVV